MEAKTIDYKNHKIIVREFNKNGDIFRSFEVKNKYGLTLWLTDILFEADYLDDCKKLIDKS